MHLHHLVLAPLAALCGIQAEAMLVQESNYTRLCSSKNILTVNGQDLRPTISARRGDIVIVDVINQATQNITIHWYGVKQPRYPWSDGPEFITQCPIQLGSRFNQKIILSGEEGTLWWHAHSDRSRATGHVMEDFLRRRGDPTISDALMINGQPGDLYNCSRQGLTNDHLKEILWKDFLPCQTYPYWVSDKVASKSWQDRWVE
ncbi:Cupredoxin [Artemisia annua]|uniref:Cupredoxin n=1 Tax=Artemisia annua TaxID=35608 RepID=A0A2U1L6A9_ARTAN|nr:Cupredoxin [Artemisia annua]